MFRCPNCGGSMPTNDVNDADYVALGEVVCGPVCHAAMYDGRQMELPLLMSFAEHRKRAIGEPPDDYRLPLRLDPG